MGLFDQFRKPQQLILDENNMGRWPEQLVEHQELHRAIDKFLREREHAIEDVRRAADSLTDERAISRIPERAMHITGQHAKLLAQYATDLVAGMEFTTDPFLLQEGLDQALPAVSEYRERVRKHEAAVDEFFSDERRLLAEAVQAVEDLLIRTGEALDRHEYSTIMQARELIAKIKEERAKKNKYEKTLNRYLSEKRANESKCEKHERKIAEQMKLIRNQDAIESLRKVKALERESESVQQLYQRLVFDTKHFLLKHGMRPAERTRELFESLRRDPGPVLMSDAKHVKEELAGLHETLKEFEEDKKDVIGRLEDAAEQVLKHGELLRRNDEMLRELKRHVIQDVAALNIYEQEQFLARAQREAADIQEKIDFLADELKNLQEDELRVELRRLLEVFTPAYRRERREDDDPGDDLLENVEE